MKDYEINEQTMAIIPISYNQSLIKEYKRNGNLTTITFKNNQQLDVDISKLSLENQISRSYKLELISRKRKLKK